MEPGPGSHSLVSYTTKDGEVLTLRAPRQRGDVRYDANMLDKNREWVQKIEAEVGESL